MLALILGFSWALDICKTGDLGDCGRKLMATHKKDPVQFAKDYNEVCVANPKFKCVKIAVRGDVKDELKLMREERPKAFLFQAGSPEDQYIYTLELK